MTGGARAIRQALVLAVLSAQPVIANDATPPNPVAQSTSRDASAIPTPTGSAAQRAVIDPRTGELLSAPAAVEQELSEDASSSTSDSGLHEELSPVPGGGVQVDLQGRFQTPLMIRVDSDGQVNISHEHGPAVHHEGE